ncbi:MAG: protein kinase [Planctomycetaceae bacterium]
MGPESHSAEFDHIVAEILRAEESDKRMSVEEWCSQHSIHARSIREFFANREQLKLNNIFGTEDMPTVMPTKMEENLSVGQSLQYFGDYQIISELARGGMGVVYKAKQTSLHRTVAIKMILSGELASEEHIARFRTEAESAAKLDHPGIVPIYEIGAHEGKHYFSMAYVAGQSLADRITGGPLPAMEAAEIVSKAALAVQYAHDLDVIHRDLKPANVLMDGDRPKITDFGLAKQLDQQSMTATGEVLGTPGYMAPEQARNAESTHKLSDVYGLGAILYATLTGRPPFQAANVIETLCQLVDSDPVPPKHLNPSIPADLETICLAALRKEPERRYESAAAMEADLRRFLEGRPVQARPVSTFEHVLKWAKRRPLIASLSTSLLLTLLVGTALISNLWIDERVARVDANRSAEDAIRNEKRADEARQEALAQKAVAEQALVTNSLGLADQLYTSGQYSEAERRYTAEFRTAKNRNTGDRRAWWRLWRTYVECPRSQVLPVGGTDVAASADGRLIAVPSGNTVSVLDGRSFAKRHFLESDIGTLAEVKFSPDSRFLVANHLAHSPLLIWDLSQPKNAPTRLQIKAAEMSGWEKALGKSVFGSGAMDEVTRMSNARVGFEFVDSQKLLACRPSAAWEFDLHTPNQKPKRVARSTRGDLTTANVMPLARNGSRIWLSNFSQMHGVPLSAVELSDDRRASHMLLGIDGDELIDISPPRSMSSMLGLPVTLLSLTIRDRKRLVTSQVFAFHPQTLRLALVQKGVLSTWDLKTGKRIAKHKWPADRLGQQKPWKAAKLVFSNDGETLAAIGSKIHILDTRSLKVRHKFGWFGSTSMGCVCFTSDGRHLLVSDQSNSAITPPIGVYPVGSNREKLMTFPRGYSTAAPRLAGDGSVFSVRESWETFLLKRRSTIVKANENSEATFEVPSSARMHLVRRFEASADGSRVVAAGTSAKVGATGEILIGFDTKSGNMFGPRRMPDGAVGLSISPQGEFTSRVDSNSIVLESLPDLTEIARIPLPPKTPEGKLEPKHRWSLTHRATSFSADSKLLGVIFNRVKVDMESAFIRSTNAEEFALVDLQGKTVLKQVSCVGGRKPLFISGNQIAIASSGSTASVQFCSVPDLEPLHRWQLGAEDVVAMAENSVRDILACATRDGRLWFWDRKRQEPLVDLKVSDSLVADMNWDHAGHVLRIVTSNEVLAIDVRTVGALVDHYLQPHVP